MESKKPTIPITAMLPAHQRVKATLETIDRLRKCDPAPDEILVHVADSQTKMTDALQSIQPSVRILTSQENLGPGGARNRMLREAQNEIVASFDDDSYPDDPDFFSELVRWFEEFPEASILALNIYEPGSEIPDTNKLPIRIRDFVGCGCAYRRSHFLEVPGYVPIPIAYGMEEADLALQYTAKGREIYFIPALRVFHDTELVHHASPKVAGMQVANTALLVFLRYPPGRCLLGVGQVINKWVDTLHRRRWKGALLAWPLIVTQIWKYRSYRQTVSKSALDTYRNLHGRRSYSD